MATAWPFAHAEVMSDSDDWTPAAQYNSYADFVSTQSDDEGPRPVHRYNDDEISDLHDQARADDIFAAAQQKEVTDAVAAYENLTGWERYKLENYHTLNQRRWIPLKRHRFRSTRFLQALSPLFENITPGQFIDAWPAENVALNNEAWLGPYCRLRQYAFIRYHTQHARITDDYMLLHYKQGRNAKERKEYAADIARMSNAWPGQPPWVNDNNPEGVFVQSLKFNKVDSDGNAIPGEKGKWVNINDEDRLVKDQGACFGRDGKATVNPAFNAYMHQQSNW